MEMLLSRTITRMAVQLSITVTQDSRCQALAHDSVRKILNGQEQIQNALQVG